ncbi:uncharacterized protein [Asterias amurensis]|uniref:uncharacterized protein n=1 Tax=Asterias amurensis TaxID=7602 RepID=UPI003AB68A93
MVRIGTSEVLVGLSDLETPGRMEEAPCLVEKVLSMLTAMGSAKPKTLHKLENALHPCTKVVPFYNPLEALEAANAMVEHPRPMVDVHNPKRQTTVTLSRKLFIAFVKEIQTKAKEGSTCIFDAAVQDGEVERSIIEDAQAWVHHCGKREGTKKELLKDFFEHCMKRVTHSSLEVAKKLEAKGYLKIDGDTVSYFLPELDATLSSQLKRISDGQSRTKASWSSFEMNEYADEIDIKDEVCMWLAEGSDIRPHEYGVIINVDVTGNGPEEYLMDVLVLQTLSSVDMKPSKLTDLLDLIKPQSLTYVVPPSRMITQTASKIKETQGKMKSQQVIRKNPKTERTNLVIGSPPGESQRRRQVPLTPEGLLRIDSHIFSTETNSTVNSAQPKWRPDKRSVALQSKGFAASLNKRLACQTSSSSAVLVPALECEKQEVVSRVIKWIDSYRSGGSSEHNVIVKGQLPTTVKLQNQLINLCTIKVRRISVASIVGCLQRLGYVTIGSESPHKIEYHIPTAKRPSGPQSTPMAPWQQRAEDFRQALLMCCSVYVERAFPSDDSESKTSSKHQLSGKRKQLEYRQDGLSKKAKYDLLVQECFA